MVEKFFFILSPLSASRKVRQSPFLPPVYTHLARLKYHQGRYDLADGLFLRALTIYEKVLGPEHNMVADILCDLAMTYGNIGKAESAKPLLRRALVIFEKKYGPEDPLVAKALEIYAKMFQMTNQKKEAIKLEERANNILAKQGLEKSKYSNLMSASMVFEDYG